MAAKKEEKNKSQSVSSILSAELFDWISPIPDSIYSKKKKAEKPAKKSSGWF